MTEVKVVCGCGQKFKFDVEPLNGRMPFAVNCPVCGADGTASANAILSASGSAAPVAVPPVIAVAPVAAARLHISQAAPAAESAPAAVATVPVLPAASLAAVAGMVRKAPSGRGDANIGLGIVGALIGAAAGAGLMFAFYQWANFRFPLMGIGIGILTGFGAKLLGKGTSTTLGSISAGLAMVAVVAALYLMYGEFPIISIISVLVSASMAYRIASG